MKLPVYGLDGASKGSVTLGAVFSTPVRPDLIERAVLSVQSRDRQPYGTDVWAGLRTAAHYHGRRSRYMSMMNREMARMSRLHGNTGHLFFTARRSPQTTKGRAAHPPKIERIYSRKVNKKEFLLAFKSAMAATADIELVRRRGHRVSKLAAAPLVVSNEIENVDKAKRLLAIFEALGLGEELTRTGERGINASVSKRGRKYKVKRGILLVVSQGAKAVTAGANIPGVEAASPKELGIEQLAPGTHPGRLLVISENALKQVEDMFGTKPKKASKPPQVQKGLAAKKPKAKKKEI